MLVSSPGGHLESGDAIHDIIRFIGAPVNMIGTGWVGSAATHLYLAVPRERRFCLPNTRFLIHQPSGGAGGPASDIAIHAREIIKARERIAQTIARETGKPLDSVMQDIERDRWLSAEEAIDYGLVGRIINNKSRPQALRHASTTKKGRVTPAFFMLASREGRRFRKPWSDFLAALASAWARLTSASAFSWAALASLSQAFFSSPFMGLHLALAAL
jgi:hypothetical protein